MNDRIQRPAAGNEGRMESTGRTSETGNAGGENQLPGREEIIIPEVPVPETTAGQSRETEKASDGADQMEPISGETPKLPVESESAAETPGASPGTETGTESESEIGMEAMAEILDFRSRPETGRLPFLAVGAAVLLAAGIGAVWLDRRLRGGKKKREAAGKMKTACVHEIGARDSQQDAFGIAESGKRELFAAVADGMGGLVDSGQVSSLLITALKNACGTGGALPPARKLQLMFREAVEEIERFMEERTARSGSTLVACLVRDGALSWLSVGDSRIYLWRSGGLIQLNRDHDFHHELVMLALQGEMTLEEADSDGRRESLTSYIGGGFPRKAEWNEEPVRLLPGDKVLLVSDGVYRALSQDELASILENPAEEAAEEIKKRIQSKKLPRQDNFTAVVLEA